GRQRRGGIVGAGGVPDRARNQLYAPPSLLRVCRAVAWGTPAAAATPTSAAVEPGLRQRRGSLFPGHGGGTGAQRDRATAPGFRHLGNRYQPAGAGSGAPGGLSAPAPGWDDRRRDTSMAGTTAGRTVSGSQCAA